MRSISRPRGSSLSSPFDIVTTTHGLVFFSLASGGGGTVRSALILAVLFLSFHPIEHAVSFGSSEHLLKQRLEVLVIRRVLESELSTVLQVQNELSGKVFAQKRERRG